MQRPRPKFEAGKKYHLYNRHLRKWRISRCYEDFERFRNLVLKKAQKYGIDLESYAIMDTHWHILVGGEGGSNVSKYAMVIQSAYSQYYNRNYGYKGQVFKGRYKYKVADFLSYVKTLRKYISENPLDRILEIYVKNVGISGCGVW